MKMRLILDVEYNSDDESITQKDCELELSSFINQALERIGLTPENFKDGIYVKSYKITIEKRK